MTFILPQKTLLLWQIRIVFAIVFVCASFLLVAGFSKMVLFLCLIIFIIGFIVSFIYVPIYFKNYELIVEKNCIIIKKGLFFKATIIMPCYNLVFYQTFATPLANMMNMKIIMLKATKKCIFIPELKNADVESILKTFRMKKCE